ncbi:MAG: hypothetical protein ACK4NA_08270 [Alphaproteobacteria bacterium]
MGMVEDYGDDEFLRDAMVVPEDFKVALADLVINFGRIEVALDRLIWWAADLANHRIGRLMTGRLDIRPKCEIVIALLSDLADPEPLAAFKPLIAKLEAVTQFRNKVIHGWWMVFGDSAVSMSARPKKFMSGAMEGAPFRVSDLIEQAQRAKEIERSIVALLRQPAPSPSRNKLDC